MQIKFEEKETIFLFLKKYLNNQRKVFLGVSGWPDSMFLFYLIKKFFEENNFPRKNIRILHFNHNYRGESQKEKQYLRKYFSWYDFITEDYEENNFTENSLRKARYNFYKKYVQGSDFLLLGHNLTDRIETSFLNIYRGCGLRWFVNMKFFSQKQNLKILRPLISLSKGKIKKLCDENKIPYFVDESNFDETMSQRNYIRKFLVNPLLEEKGVWRNFLESFSNIYQQIENLDNSRVKLKRKKLPNIFEYEECYEVAWVNSSSEIIELFDLLGVCYNLTSANISDIENVINKNTWYKYFNWWFFIFASGRLFVVKTDKKFWEVVPPNEKRYLKTSWSCYFFWKKININYNHLWGLLRLPEKKDLYKWKKIKKAMLNQKIPFFLRDVTPVVEKNWQILDILPFKF